MIGNYNSWLVFLSVVVATLASYVALDLASRVVATQGTRAARYWLFGGALSMGTGIWSMHFIGMLAFELPIPMAYDVGITLASLVIAVVVSGFALYTISHGTLHLRRLLGGGSLMGVGIACMHYTGMAAMYVEPRVHYNGALFAASVVIAIIASVAALWIAFQLRTETILSAFWKKAGSAVVMGFAITGMHYTGMASAIFAPDTVCSVSPQDINNVWLAGAIGGFTFMLLATTLLVSVFDAYLANRATKYAANLRRLNADLEEQAAQLQRHGRELEERVAERTGELALANTRLRREFDERAAALTALGESEERYRRLFELSPDGMLILTDGKIVLVNSMCMKLFGAASPQELIGRPVLELFHPDYRERVMERLLSTQKERLPLPAAERKIVTLDGTALDVEVAASPFSHRGKASVQVVLRDITDRKKAEERLNYLAQFDSLTGLPNRSLFRDRLEHTLAQAKRSGRPAAVLFVDLDRFKEVNDTLGHAMGDMLLQQVATRLTECVRSGDTVGRFGGDEFGLILPDLTRPGDAGVVAQKINQALARPIDLKGNRAFITASVGITLYPADAADPETLSMNADTAMYRAKELGRNAYRFFTSEMNERAMQRMQMETAMRRALERGEFVLHYQPKVNLASGAVCGCEALLRWARPDGKLVFPGEFISTLEDTGLIIPVGEWVTREACRQIRQWQQAGLRVPPVAVNLSARQFQQKKLQDTICGILRETSVDPALMQLEITESLLMDDPKEAERVLHDLKRAGVRLFIDDFGTGYSSLAYLKRFSLDGLKIDRAFVKNIVNEPDDAAITLAIISLARSLRLKVVAEGVESEAQLNLLALHSCDEMQGYYFSKPVPAAELEAMVRAGRLLQRSQDWAGTKPAVLLLDDSAEDLVLLRHALRSEQFDVLTANSPEEAFILLASHPVGVVVSDQRMPGMDGAEFLSKLRRLYPKALRVAITGARDPEILAEAVNDAGIDKLLSKTWDSERLRAEVCEAYQRALGTRRAS